MCWLVAYRSKTLVEHDVIVKERVTEGKVRPIVENNNLKFEFMAGRSGGARRNDVIFIVRLLQEKYLAKKEDMWMAFVDSEKAFDMVPWKMVWALKLLNLFNNAVST